MPFAVFLFCSFCLHTKNYKCIFVHLLVKDTPMYKMKYSFFAVLMLCAVTLFSCSKEEDEESVSPTEVLEAKLTDGYFFNGNKSRQAIRFFPDHTFQWMEKNAFDKYDRDSEAVYPGAWAIENEADVVLKWDDYSPPNKKAPTLMLRISFVDGKMAFSDQNGANCLYTKGELSTFINDEMRGRTFKASNSYTYGGINLRSTQTVVFREDGTVDWELEERIRESDVVRHQYAATGQSWMNISEDEIYIEWFYKGEGNIPYDEVVEPPLRMTHLRSEINSKGDWLLYFEDGYDYLSNTNYVRK